MTQLGKVYEHVHDPLTRVLPISIGKNVLGDTVVKVLDWYAPTPKIGHKFKPYIRRLLLEDFNQYTVSDNQALDFQLPKKLELTSEDERYFKKLRLLCNHLDSAAIRHTVTNFFQGKYGIVLRVAELTWKNPVIKETFYELC